MTMDGPIVGIHQPEYFPWLGFVDKALRSDVFILLDDVPFRKNYFQNRNRILTPAGPQWVTVPVLLTGRSNQPIAGVEIANTVNPRWREKHLQSWTQNYRSAPYAKEYLPILERLYAREWSRLADFNVEIIREVFAAFRVTARVVRSSELPSSGSSTEKLLTLCQATGAKTYLSGISGREYLDTSLFDRAGITISYQEFRHPVYRQRQEPFQDCLSCLDMLLNVGPESRKVLMDSASPRLEKVYL